MTMLPKACLVVKLLLFHLKQIGYGQKENTIIGNTVLYGATSGQTICSW